MEFVNESGFEGGWTMNFDREGRELLVIAVKATYVLPPQEEEPELAKEQQKLVMADEFSGDPGVSAPLRETDYAAFKPRCDVVLNGSAHAPAGAPVRSVP